MVRPFSLLRDSARRLHCGPTLNPPGPKGLPGGTVSTSHSIRDSERDVGVNCRWLDVHQELPPGRPDPAPLSGDASAACPTGML